ncbi:hypothetical protein MKW92_032905 [Papaver armeniacum]|nr:hypothetical protein MKW92_032905 [Papaver armeniacum]
MAVESDNAPLKTEPKPPPPNFCEKFFVALRNSEYVYATNVPSTVFDFPTDLLDLHIITSTRASTRIAMTLTTAPTRAALNGFFFFVPSAT